MPLIGPVEIRNRHTLPFRQLTEEERRAAAVNGGVCTAWAQMGFDGKVWEGVGMNLMRDTGVSLHPIDGGVWVRGYGPDMLVDPRRRRVIALMAGGYESVARGWQPIR